LYDEDNELKKQLDSLLKKEEQLQRLFDEQEEARGVLVTRSNARLASHVPSHVTRPRAHPRVAISALQSAEDAQRTRKAAASDDY
jgi:hypothetical protein